MCLFEKARLFYIMVRLFNSDTYTDVSDLCLAEFLYFLCVSDISVQRNQQKVDPVDLLFFAQKALLAQAEA